MSVVAVKVYKDKIEISADTIGLRGNTKEQVCKLTEINNMIIGSCGYIREFGLLNIFAKTHQPADATEKDIIDFMYEFCKWKQSYLDFESDNSYIMIYKSKVFYIGGFEVLEVKDFSAIGAGRDFALAALYLGHSAKEAVKVTCKLSNLVSEPIETKVIDL